MKHFILSMVLMTLLAQRGTSQTLDILKTMSADSGSFNMNYRESVFNGADGKAVFLSGKMNYPFAFKNLQLIRDKHCLAKIFLENEIETGPGGHDVSGILSWAFTAPFNTDPNNPGLSIIDFVEINSDKVVILGLCRGTGTIKEGVNVVRPEAYVKPKAYTINSTIPTLPDVYAMVINQRTGTIETVKHYANTGYVKPKKLLYVNNKLYIGGITGARGVLTPGVPAAGGYMKGVFVTEINTSLEVVSAKVQVSGSRIDNMDYCLQSGKLIVAIDFYDSLAVNGFDGRREVFRARTPGPGIINSRYGGREVLLLEIDPATGNRVSYKSFDIYLDENLYYNVFNDIAADKIKISLTAPDNLNVLFTYSALKGGVNMRGDGRAVLNDPDYSCAFIKCYGRGMVEKFSKKIMPGLVTDMWSGTAVFEVFPIKNISTGLIISMRWLNASGELSMEVNGQVRTFNRKGENKEKYYLAVPFDLSTFSFGSINKQPEFGYFQHEPQMKYAMLRNTQAVSISPVITGDFACRIPGCRISSRPIVLA